MARLPALAPPAGSAPHKGYVVALDDDDVIYTRPGLGDAPFTARWLGVAPAVGHVVVIVVASGEPFVVASGPE